MSCRNFTTRDGKRLVGPLVTAQYRSFSQIPHCICSISHNAHFRTEMCTFLFWMMHCGIWNRCIVGFVNKHNYLCKYPLSLNECRFASTEWSQHSTCVRWEILCGNEDKVNKIYFGCRRICINTYMVVTYFLRTIFYVPRIYLIKLQSIHDCYDFE